MTDIVVFEDNNLLVINKPAGMIVNKAQTTVGKITLEDWLEERYKDLRLERKGIVHRLDKDTSGLLVIAKNQSVMLALQAQFKERQVKKSYLALLHGDLKPEQGTISAPIGRNPFNRQRFGIFVGGRAAVTEYRLKARLVSPEGEHLSLVEAFPLSGRTHQLRVHFKSLNHPLVADPWYGGRKTSRADLRWCPRLFLHAQNLQITHPVSKKLLELTAILPKDLQNVLDNLKKVDE